MLSRPRVHRCIGVLGGVLLLIGCGNSVERNIKKLDGTQEEREEAMMELVLAKQNAIPPLVEALRDRTSPSQVRADVAEVLFRVYVREKDKKILLALLESLDDEDTPVRTRTAVSLGYIGDETAMGPLLERLVVEENDTVRPQVLGALEVLGGWKMGIGGRGKDGFPRNDHAVGGENMGDEEKGRFIEILKDIWGNEESAELRANAEELLENMARQLVQEADELMLLADLEQAEAKLLEACELVEGSKNANYRLGKFYFDNGAREKGLSILRDHGMLIYAERLPRAPVIDGVLSDEIWKEATKITEFYQCIRSMRAAPTEGRSEAYVGYTDHSLYIAVKGYEESTSNLIANATVRDGRVSRDDCTEIFLDTDLDYDSCYQILVNTIGVVGDHYCRYGKRPSSWDGEYGVGAKVEDTFWVVEVVIPFRTLDGARVKKGDIWGFNVSRVRMGVAEYGQWVPTYGSSLRPASFGLLVFG